MDDEESLFTVLSIIIIVGFTIVSAFIKWYEWISSSIGLSEFIAWSVIAICVGAIGRIYYWIYKRKK